MHNIITRMTIFVTLFFPCSSVALAEHFEFSIPVQLNQIRQGIARAKVFCEVLDKAEQRIGARYGDWLTINNGKLDTTTRIKFNAYNGKNPLDATKYRCHLELLMGWVKDHPWQLPPAQTNSMYLNHEAGTPFHVIVSGEIKRPARLRPHIKLKPQIKR